MIRFDHLAFAALTLAQGNDWFCKATGLQMPMGGQHLQMATHNRVTAVGLDSYLEIIAPDPAIRPPDHPRWFGLDDPGVRRRLESGPVLLTWIVATDNIEAAIARAAVLGVDYGHPVTLHRGDLTWRFALRLDGTLPLDGAAPQLIQWPQGPHAASRMADLGIRLQALQIETPQADRLTGLLRGLQMTSPPQIRTAAGTALTATLTLRDKSKILLT
jgi:Glyoxalase-like domain